MAAAKKPDRIASEVSAYSDAELRSRIRDIVVGRMRLKGELARHEEFLIILLREHRKRGP